MTKIAKDGLAKLPTHMQQARILASNLNHNFAIEFIDPSHARCFLEACKNDPIIWTDPLDSDANTNKHVMNFWADRSLPDRQLGQVMGVFLARVQHLIHHRFDPDVKILCSKPKGVIFAVQGDHVVELAKAVCNPDGNFVLTPLREGLARFRIASDDVDTLMLVVKKELALKRILI